MITPKPLSKEELDELEAILDSHEDLGSFTVRTLIAQARRAIKLEARIAELEASSKVETEALMEVVDKLRAAQAALAEAESALDTAVYDLERIRDADWTIEQARMGARSGAHVARAALAKLREARGGGGK